jgi:hypothetical protein
MRTLAKALGVLMCGVVAAAIGASSASAVTLHECKEGKGTGIAYTNATCSAQSESGKFQTVAIPLNTATALTFTATSTTTLSATIAGVKFKIACTGGSGSGTATNTESGGSMKVIGSNGHVRFEGCTVTEPSGKGCTVPSTIETNTVKSQTSEMKDVIVPATGESFVTIPLSGCSAEALNGEKVISGSASGTNSGGSTTEFTSTSGSALKFGGQAATLIGSTHSKVTSTGVIVGLETP